MSILSTSISACRGHSILCPSNPFHSIYLASPKLTLTRYGLLKFLKQKYAAQGSGSRVSVERVVAGSGLPDVYEYLSQTFPEQVDAAIHSAIATGGDFKAAVVAKNKNRNALCRRTMDIFLTHYGSEAGVACLKWMPTGGLYITGGNTPKNIAEISAKDGLFLQALRDKGRVRGMLAECPVFAVLVEDLGARGAHFMSYKELQLQLQLQAQAQAQRNDKGKQAWLLPWARFAVPVALWAAAAAMSTF